MQKWQIRSTSFAVWWSCTTWAAAVSITGCVSLPREFWRTGTSPECLWFPPAWLSNRSGGKKTSFNILPPSDAANVVSVYLLVPSDTQYSFYKPLKAWLDVFKEKKKKKQAILILESLTDVSFSWSTGTIQTLTMTFLIFNIHVYVIQRFFHEYLKPGYH